MTEKFDEILEKAVEEGLDDLGETVKQVLVYYIEKFYGLRRGRMARDPYRLHEALINMLNEAGARIVEKHVLLALCDMLHLDYNKLKYLDFPEAVEKAEKMFRESR